MQQGLKSKVDKWSSLRNQVKRVALVSSYFDRGGGNSVGNNCPLRRGGGWGADKLDKLYKLFPFTSIFGFFPEKVVDFDFSHILVQ